MGIPVVRAGANHHSNGRYPSCHEAGVLQPCHAYAQIKTLRHEIDLSPANLYFFENLLLADFVRPEQVPAIHAQWRVKVRKAHRTIIIPR